MQGREKCALCMGNIRDGCGGSWGTTCLKHPQFFVSRLPNGVCDLVSRQSQLVRSFWWVQSPGRYTLNCFQPLRLVDHLSHLGEVRKKQVSRAASCMARKPATRSHVLSFPNGETTSVEVSPGTEPSHLRERVLRAKWNCSSYPLPRIDSWITLL